MSMESLCRQLATSGSPDAIERWAGCAVQRFFLGLAVDLLTACFVHTLGELGFQKFRSQGSHCEQSALTYLASECHKVRASICLVVARQPAKVSRSSLCCQELPFGSQACLSVILGKGQQICAALSRASLRQAGMSVCDTWLSRGRCHVSPAVLPNKRTEKAHEVLPTPTVP